MFELQEKKLCFDLQTREAGDESSDFCNRISLQIASLWLGRLHLPSSSKALFYASQPERLLQHMFLNSSDLMLRTVGRPAD